MSTMATATAADDTLKIIVTLLAIAVIYCLVEVVRYWRRNTHTYSYKKSHHQSQHEQEYDERAAAIEDILKHEEALFKQPPPNDDCPICFLTLPTLETGQKYMSCCGKIICSGCIDAVDKMKGVSKCPFCRVPTPVSYEEIVERAKKRVEMNDAEAIYTLGCYYNRGVRGLPQDRDKALEMFHQAGELGSNPAYHNIGNAYDSGRGVEKDEKKANYYWKLAAIRWHAGSRYNLGCIEEEDAGNMVRALKHYMIAAGCGHDKSLKEIREFYVNGHATKDDYAKALRAHQKYIDGIKSAQRD